MKKDLVVAAVSIVVIVAVCFGLALARPNVPATPSQPFAPAASPSGAKAEAAAGKVVMHVNGEAITEREFNAFIQTAPAESRPFYASPAGRRALADELVKLKSLEQEAHRMGIDRDPEIETQVSIVRSQITAGRALEKLVSQRVDQHLRAEYERQKGNAVNLRHILVAYQGGEVPPRQGAPLPVDQAMAKAKAIAAKLAGGADFAELAKSVSDDQQSAGRGGALGTTRLENLPPEVSGVVKGLKPGQVSAPVKTSFGIHIFKVEPVTLEDLKPMLTQQIQRQAAEEAISSMQKTAKVELDPSFFPAPAPKTPGTPAAPRQGRRGTL